MKHLLNNISEEEKNRIREQHEGGMNLSIDNFKKLVETKLGEAKPFINEASEETCEQCGGMMKEGECVEQCGSMKEEVSEQSEDDVIRLIMDINTKLPDDLKSRMVIMKDFDQKQMVSFFERLMSLAEKHFKKELDEQNSPVGTLKDDEVEVLAKKIVDCLDGDDEMKKLLFRLNLDSKMYRTFFDKAMIEMGDYINSFGPKGPLG